MILFSLKCERLMCAILISNLLIRKKNMPLGFLAFALVAERTNLGRSKLIIAQNWRNILFLFRTPKRTEFAFESVPLSNLICFCSFFRSFANQTESFQFNSPTKISLNLRVDFS